MIEIPRQRLPSSQSTRSFGMVDPKVDPHDEAEAAPFPATVLWTRGDGCRELAELLASGRAIQVEGGPAEAGIRHRADMVVMKRAGSLDLLPVAAPTAFDPDGASNVVAAVGEGPHSELAAVVAGRLAHRLGVPVEAVTVVRPGAPRADARRTVDRARAKAGIPGSVVEAESAVGLLETIAPSSLLVLGASGGSWLQRQFFGPGARLRSHAPAGTVVVRNAPKRAFQLMSAPSGVSPHLGVVDALAVVTEVVTPVVAEGHLVGVVRKQALAKAVPEVEVESVMEIPAFVEATDAIEDLREVLDFYEGSPIPLVDRKGRLVGMLDSGDVPTG